MECNNFRAVRQPPAGSEHNRPAPGAPFPAPPNTPWTGHAGWPRDPSSQRNAAGTEAWHATRETREHPSMWRFQLSSPLPVNGRLPAIAGGITDRRADSRPRRAVKIDLREVRPFLLPPLPPAAPYTPSPGLSPDGAARALQTPYPVRASVQAPTLQAPSVQNPSVQNPGVQIFDADPAGARIAARETRIMQAWHLLTAATRADAGREAAPFREPLPRRVWPQAARPVIDPRLDRSRAFLLDIAYNGSQPVPGTVPSHRLPDLHAPDTGEHVKRPKAFGRPAYHTHPAARATLDARPRRQVVVMHVPSS